MDDLGNKEIMARNIQYYMDKYGKTRQDMCEALGVKYTTFTDWVKGNSYPRIDKIELMANYFGILKADLVENHNNHSENGRYYINGETAQAAQEIFENKELRALFDVQRDMEADDLRVLHNMALALKKKERGNGDDTGC